MQTIRTHDDLYCLVDEFCGGSCNVVPLYIMAREIYQAIDCAQYNERLPLHGSRRTGSQLDTRDVGFLCKFCDMCDFLDT